MAQVPIMLNGSIDIETCCVVCGKDLTAAIMVDQLKGKITISIDPSHDCKSQTIKDKNKFKIYTE